MIIIDSYLNGQQNYKIFADNQDLYKYFIINILNKTFLIIYVQREEIIEEFARIFTSIINAEKNVSLPRKKEIRCHIDYLAVNKQHLIFIIMKLNLNKKWLIVYGITLVVFLVYICFLADYSFLKQHELKKKIKIMDNKITEINNTVSNTSSYEEIKQDPELLEKYAREQMNMQKEDEDVFIMIHK